MVTKSSGDARLRILQAAADALVQTGAGGLRVDAVAHAAGVNKRMIYHYFGDKEGLVRALYSQQAQCMFDGSAALQPPTRAVLYAFLTPLIAQRQAPPEEHIPQSNVTPGQLQTAAQILLPVLMQEAVTPGAVHVITAEQWASFTLDMVSLAFANVAADVFHEMPGSVAFRQQSNRLLTPKKPLYRISSDSRLR